MKAAHENSGLLIFCKNYKHKPLSSADEKGTLNRDNYVQLGTNS